MTVADPRAVQTAVDGFVGVLERHQALWRTGRSIAGDNYLPVVGPQLESVETQVFERHAQIAAIAERVQPGLDDLIRLRLRTNPREWKFEAVLASARILKGAVDRLAETEAMLGPPSHDIPSRWRSTPEQRTLFGRAILQLGAVEPTSAVTSQAIGMELGLSSDVLEDIETWLHAAGLIKFVDQSPSLYLSTVGFAWAASGGSLGSPPIGSNTVIHIHVAEGASVGSIQSAGSGSTQTAEVVIDQTAALRGWVEEVRDWLPRVGCDPEERGRLLTRLEDLDEELKATPPDPVLIRRGWQRAHDAFSRIAINATGSAAGAGLIEVALYSQVVDPAATRGEQLRFRQLQPTSQVGGRRAQGFSWEVLVGENYSRVLRARH